MMNAVEKIEKIENSSTYKKIRTGLLKKLKQSGNNVPYFADLVDDYMKLYTAKELAYEDIRERGNIVPAERGSKKNESIDQLLKTNLQMIKILDKLEIKPESVIDDDDDRL